MLLTHHSFERHINRPLDVEDQDRDRRELVSRSPESETRASGTTYDRLTTSRCRKKITRHRYTQGRIDHSGAPYQSKAGPFSHTRSQDFLRGGLFFSQKVDELFFTRRYL